MPFMRYGVFLFTIVAVVLHGQDHNDPPVHCVSCHNVHDARVCPHLIQCDGECFERTEDQNGTRTKSYGCVKRKDCTASASIIGRRSSLSNTTTYCKKELCNKDIHHFIVPPTEPCVDISVGDCRDPAALAAICSECELAQYCRKSCGLCQEHTGTTTWSENLVLFDYYPAHNQCNYSQAIGPSICHSIKAHGRAEQHADIHHFIVPPTEPCVDISVGDCRDPAALAAICSECELAQYCRKSCGLCQEHTGTTTWSENLVLFDYYPAHNQCNYSQAIGPSICHSIKAHGRAEQHAGYLNLPTYDSLVHVHFTTNGEPLTNLQLLSCQTTGKGRVDIILNNATIAEAYNETSVWAWDWTLHELNPAQHKGTHNYTLVIVKDRKVRSYGHYWLRNIRLETTVVHHGHN